jgi:hypothetical protein
MVILCCVFSVHHGRPQALFPSFLRVRLCVKWSWDRLTFHISYNLNVSFSIWLYRAALKVRSMCAHLHSQYTHITLTVHSQYTHSTPTVYTQYTQYTQLYTQFTPKLTQHFMFPYIYLRHVVAVPYLDCEPYRGQCYWKRVKAVWLSGDWNVTVSTGSIRPWLWEDTCSVTRWEGLLVAAVAIADSCLILLLNVAMCIAHQMHTDISYLFGQLNLHNAKWKWPCPYITWFNTLPVRW